MEKDGFLADFIDEVTDITARCRGKRPERHRRRSSGSAQTVKRSEPRAPTRVSAWASSSRTSHPRNVDRSWRQPGREGSIRTWELCDCDATAPSVSTGKRQELLGVLEAISGAIASALLPRRRGPRICQRWTRAVPRSGCAGRLNGSGSRIPPASQAFRMPEISSSRFSGRRDSGVASALDGASGLAGLDGLSPQPSWRSGCSSGYSRAPQSDPVLVAPDSKAL